MLVTISNSNGITKRIIYTEKNNSLPGQREILDDEDKISLLSIGEDPSIYIKNTIERPFVTAITSKKIIDSTSSISKLESISKLQLLEQKRLDICKNCDKWVPDKQSCSLAPNCTSCYRKRSNTMCPDTPPKWLPEKID